MDEKYCKKEKEIAEMHTDLQQIKKVVMGNGNEGLIVSVPKLAQSVDTLNEKTIPDLQKGVHGFLKYQQEQEGRHEAKSEMKTRNRWMVGILIGVIVALTSGLIGTIHLLLK